MNYSRRQLYALGEPIGEAVTRTEGGRRIYGGGGGSSSSSSTATTTQNTDKRIAVEQGIGISSDSSTITVEALDANIVNKALDTVATADATSGAGFTQLLTLADRLFTGAGAVISDTQGQALKQLETLNAAGNDSRGQIDQKTMIVLAVAGAAAFVMARRKG